MPRCAHCGKNNREGSLFCQECGHKLEAAPARPAAPAATSGTACPQCGTVNPAGMNFCKMCGTALAPRPVAAAPAPAPAPRPAPAPSAAPVQPAPAQPSQPNAAAGKVACSSCGKLTPGGFAFCQHCGTRLATAQKPQSAAPEAFAPTIATANPSPSPTPPAGMRAAAATPPAAAAPRPVAAPAPVSAPPQPAAAASPVAYAATVGAPAPVISAAAAAPRQVIAEPTPASAVVHGRLVVLRRDGSDGELHNIEGDTFDVGRGEGSLIFRDDPFLATRHARFVGTVAGVRVRPLDGVNGVYLRLRTHWELASGDQFILGKELMRYESVSPEERDPPSLVEHGVRLLGSAQREAWGRLREMTGAGTTRNIYYLTRPELVFGREEGDVVFPDDEFMSRRHAAVRRSGKGARLEDMGSSNGTFARLRGEHDLADGDVLRMGDQLLRFER